MFYFIERQACFVDIYSSYLSRTVYLHDLNKNMASTLSEEQFQCSICLYSFKNPVSILCGHNFCLECIKRYWDVAQKSDCPLCKESFGSRPELRVNWTLKEITERFQSLLKEMPGFKAKRPIIPLLPIRSGGEKEIKIKPLQTRIKKTQEQYQQMIQIRIRKTEEIKQSMELSKRNKEREIQASVQNATMMVSAIERNQALLIEEIEQKQEVAEKRAEELLKEISQEINELQKRCSELHLLEHIENPVQLQQNFLHLNTPMSVKHWADVRVQSESYARTVRRNFSKLVDICQELERKLCAEEVNKMNKYAVDVTLDPATAAGWVVLSPDNKKVSMSYQPGRTPLPDDPRRFDSCVAVLGKQSFTSGKRYWVVQVGDKRDWDLGVAQESINRKGAITVRPDNGYWAICRRNGGSLYACAGPAVTLHLKEIPQKVGIFLDYEEGSVSFYNTEAKTHIYTYSGLTFTEPLYPYFNPCIHDNGKKTAQLVICPIEAGITVDPSAR
ncbi:E3 ubiquitin-protein ligase TRIM21-like [Haplochromis burtoni]|uniref:E3 ubiquitin-protein ligase TRIM21-like n=1 Tax=Haplochromis burtoni TaxID=8153 RepID=UPI001C2D1121|nr:E3 ubiquitin-protein ligase TRIM21-like [Haplochromis burtoni]